MLSVFQSYLINSVAKVPLTESKRHAPDIDDSHCLLMLLNCFITGQGQEVQSLPLGLESDRAIDQL